MKYLISDIVIESRVELPQLAASDRKDVEFVFSIDGTNRISYDSYKPFRDIHLPNRQLWLSIGKSVNDYLLRFPKICDFIISGNDSSIVCHSASSSINTVRYIFLNHVIPLYLSSRKKFVLHCSTVNINNNAILFIGDSTSGKSTLAASCCKEGHKLLTDDFLLIRETNSNFLAIPSYPSIRLHSDTISKTLGITPTIFDSDIFEYKKWIRADEDGLPYSENPVPIKFIYILGNTNTGYLKEGIDISAIRPSESVVELLNNSFVIDLSDTELLKSNLDFCASLVEKIPVKRLTYSKDFSMLSAIREMIISYIQ